MKTGFSLCGKLQRENPVLALFWPCTGLQRVQPSLGQAAPPVKRVEHLPKGLIAFTENNPRT